MINPIKSHGGNITMKDVQIENEEAMALPLNSAVLLYSSKAEFGISGY
tara:strand:- start:1595 stop:1738 length:144 start_codon:yes stop_codon:yes gene_type:complete